MRQVTIDEIENITAASREEIWRKAGECNREPKVYLHWSAGHYNTCFDDYHINITGSGDIFVSTDNFADTLNHTYKRNTGATGISLACAYGANTKNLGDEPPTEEQIETMAKVIAAVCKALWLTIDKTHVLTHGEAADNEDGITNLHEEYGPKNTCERWDLEYLGTDESPAFTPYSQAGDRGGDVLRGKANWYANEESGENGAKNKPVGGDRFMQSNNVESPEEKIWQFLKDKGLNDYAVAGIMGNLYAESGLKPTNLENYYEAKLGMTDEEYTAAVDNGSYGNFVYDKAGYGLAQWTYYTRKQNLFDFAKSCGASIGDIDMQLAYLWQEFNGYPTMMKKLTNATSVFEASNAMLLEFERPADQSEQVRERRANFGVSFYDKFANTNKKSATEKEDEDMRYDMFDELPAWAKSTIQKLIDKGLLNGDGATLDLSKDMLRILVINDRAGIYGE